MLRGHEFVVVKPVCFAWPFDIPSRDIQTASHRNRESQLKHLQSWCLEIGKEVEEIEDPHESRANDQNGVEFGQVQERNPQIQGTSSL